MARAVKFQLKVNVRLLNSEIKERSRADLEMFCIIFSIGADFELGLHKIAKLDWAARALEIMASISRYRAVRGIKTPRF